VEKTFNVPDVKWLWIFPKHLEKRFQSFDDPIIDVCQKLQGKVWKYISLAMTACVTIELGIAVPFVLFFMGQDGIATEFVYLAFIAALISQIPKRFVWRFRPYMVNRANLVKKDQTSSFPSRAVTCATVYSFAIIWAYTYINTPDDGDVIFRWWMPVLIIFAILLSSFARINLGVHYPTDCVAGVLQGILICTIGTALWKTDILGCESCHKQKCYAGSPGAAITISSGFAKLNWWLAVVVFGICVGIPIISVMKPIDFWNKCDRVYGMLLPCVAFQVLFLCPSSTREGYALNPPHFPSWYSFILGPCLAAGATIIGQKFGGTRPLVSYALLSSSLLGSLVLWRVLRM